MFSLNQFLETGCAFGICLGSTREEIISAWGEPEAIERASTSKRSPTIMKYGDVECHVDSEGKCYLLFFDFERSKEKFRLPPKVSVGDWGIERGSTKQEVIEFLTRKGCSLERVEFVNAYRLSKSGVSFTFDDSDVIASISILRF